VNDKLPTPQQPAAGTWLASATVYRVQTFASKLRWALALPAVAVLFAFADRPPMWPGIVLALCGECIQLWASAHLRKNVDVIMSGPYALARNPMYLGRFLVGLGLVLLTWRWFLIVPFAIGFALYAQARVLGEEAHLRSLFGKKYEDYCAATRRWFPWPPRRRFSEERWSWQCVLRNHQLRVTVAVVIGLILIEWRISSLGRLPW
jgi:protein-S-isoprenylcysteine O-methyltransferase Ste14